MSADAEPTRPAPVAVTLSRRYPAAPLVGTGVAVFDDAGRVLLVRRGRPPRAGSWGLPGGLLDLGERLVDGARREVREECGIDVAIGGLVAAFEPMEYDAEGRLEYHYVVLDYWARHVAGTPVAGDDAAAVAWVAMDDLPAYALRPETLSVVRQAHALWAAGREA